MLNKKIFMFFLIALIFSFDFNNKIFSQEKNQELSLTEENLSARDENALANKIRQPFAWESAGDVLKYQIEIYKIEEKTLKEKEVFSYETNEEESENCLIYIEPPLAPGHYRSKIKVFNILGGLEEELTSEDTFIVRRAYKPEIKSVTYPLYMRSTVYLDDYDNNGIIEIEGRNLFESKKENDQLVFTDYFLKANRKVLAPQSIIYHSSDNRKVSFQFDMKSLEVGDYYFIAQDASGLYSEEDKSSKFSVKFKKWMDFDIEAGYVIPVLIHDQIFEEYFDTKVFPFSAQARATFIPYKRAYGYLGLGLRLSYSRLNADFSTYSIDGNLATSHLLFIYQLPLFKRRVFFEVHGGPGITYFNNIVFHFANSINSKELNTISPSFDAGGAVQIYVNKRIYLELAADYIFTLNAGNMMGHLMPSAGIGWQF